MVIPDLHVSVMGRNHLRRDNPIDRIDDECVAADLFLSSNNDQVLFSVDFNHIKRLPFGQPKTLSLADGIKSDSLVSPQDISFLVLDGAGVNGLV